MKLNKNSSYVLLHLLNGNTTAADISKQMLGVDIRSIQRALSRLTEIGLIERKGPSNRPTYSTLFENLLAANIPDKLLEDTERPETKFNHELIRWLSQVQPHYLSQIIGETVKLPSTQAGNLKMTAKELEYLTVELSWKSSALEGNTYTLLDTQLLLVEGVKAKNRTEFETQMILNHKNAVAFIIENPELFTNKITFPTIEELHKIISYNLGISRGIRKRLVKVTASNYVPMANPHQLRENAELILEIIARAPDTFHKSLFALSLVPYLQIFEDGNKRTGRMLANAILISIAGRGFSLRKVSARELALAYLAFYEFNSLKSLSKILRSELSK
jgi:Fic family protein